MKLRKNHSSLAAPAKPAILLAGLVLTTGAHATPSDEYEGFDYPAGSSIYLQTGGSGWTGAWGTPGGLDATISSNSLTFGNLAVAPGALDTAGFQPPFQGASVATWIRYLGTPLGADNTTAYLSFLFQPHAGYGYYGGINFGNVFVGLSGNQAVYGLEGPLGQLNLSSVTTTVAQTVFFVMQVNFLPGNDQISLYLNPVAGQPQPSLPDVFKPDLDVGNVDFLVINNYGGFTVDELRLGSTYDSVTPIATVPEPAYGRSFGLLLTIALGLRSRKISR